MYSYMINSTEEFKEFRFEEVPVSTFVQEK